MSVTSLRTIHEQPSDKCTVCGGENSKHWFVRMFYPWPMNLSVFKHVLCPKAGGNNG